ncbi:MAG: tetratricopeptide repeat protein [Gemmatimonadota bacterium]
MPGPAPSERDLAVIRSFARRIDPSDAGAHNNLGVLYYQKGLVAEAIAEFLRALELDPKMQVAQGNLEIAYHATGYYDRRVAELREKLRRHADDREARWELGRTYASLGHFTEAVTEFEALLARQPADIGCLIQLGLAQKARGDLDTASEAFRRACEIDPGSSVTLFYYGEALYNRGLSDQARSLLEEAVIRNPDNADAFYLLAFVYGDLGEHERARAATKRAIALNPTFARAQSNLSLVRYRDRNGQSLAAGPPSAPRPTVSEGGALAHFNLGLAFRQKGYYVEALREYKLALDSGEDRRLTMQAMAEVHLLRRDLAAALELYGQLVDEVGDSPKLWNERGVCLHQSGRREDADASYEKAIAADPDYALAWNNLGVLRAGASDGESALECFQRALRAKSDLVAARLNLALLLLQRRRLQLSLEAYRQVLADDSGDAVAWNGVGLVLVELKRFDDARNAFSRAVDADPTNASAHYNLSFTLSHLGDFDGALRETKRALEIEPYYVQQKFALTIDLQYENPTISIVPQISADITAEEVGGDFSFDTRLLDRIFDELETPGHTNGVEPAATEDPLALATDYVAKGLLELAAAEVDRAVHRGAPPARAGLLLGEIFAKRGLHGEALERYREAQVHAPGLPEAMLGEVRALLALERGHEAAPTAEAMLLRLPGNVEALVAVARTRLVGANPVGALDLLREAQALAPGRPDLLQLQARVAARLGDREAAVEAYQAALQLDASLAQVWFELGGLEEQRENWVAARLAYDRALDLLPTFMEAALAVADLVRRVESPAAAVDLLVDILHREPWDLDALLLLGRCLLEDGRADRALEALRRLLRFDPENQSALYHTGQALARLQQYPEAVRAWERVIQVDAGGPFAQLARTHARSARDLQHIFARGAD